ncbi:ALP1-like protein isoform X1 [Tanacetum coccineum]
MAHPLFNRIVTAVTNHDPYFHNNIDYTGRKGISLLIKCTSAIRQLAYSVNASFLDEYMQISERSSRMALFNRIVTAVTNHDPYFHNNIDYTGRKGISLLIKCTSSIRQLAYIVNASFLDEYMQISERSSRMALDHFFEVVMDIYGPEYLRKPTVTDIEKLYRHHEEKHKFLGMLGCLDCTNWEWFGCPYAFKGQFVRRGHGSNPFILLEVVVSQDL